MRAEFICNSDDDLRGGGFVASTPVTGGGDGAREPRLAAFYDAMRMNKTQKTYS